MTGLCERTVITPAECECPPEWIYNPATGVCEQEDCLYLQYEVPCPPGYDPVPPCPPPGPYDPNAQCACCRTLTTDCNFDCPPGSTLIQMGDQWF